MRPRSGGHCPSKQQGAATWVSARGTVSRYNLIRRRSEVRIFQAHPGQRPAARPNAGHVLIVVAVCRSEGKQRAWQTATLD